MHGWIDGQIARQTDRQTCGFLISRMYVFFIYAFIIIFICLYNYFIYAFSFIYAFIFYICLSLFRALNSQGPGCPPASRAPRPLRGLAGSWGFFGGFGLALNSKGSGFRGLGV